MDVVRDNSSLNLKPVPKPLGLGQVIEICISDNVVHEPHATESPGCLYKTCLPGPHSNTTMGWSSHLHQRPSSQEILMYAYCCDLFCSSVKWHMGQNLSQGGCEGFR